MSNPAFPAASFTGVDPGYPFNYPAVFFDDFIVTRVATSEAGAIVLDFSTTENNGVWQVGGTNAAVALTTNILPLELTSANGSVAGAVTFTTTGASGDDMYMQLNGTSFFCQTGKPLAMQFRFRPDTITTVANHFGLYAADAVGATTTNPHDTQPVGFGMIYDAGSVKYQVKSAAGTTTPTAAGATITASTTDGWVTGTILWDGIANLSFAHNGVTLVTVSANIPTGIYLSPVFGLSTGSAATKAMTVDYIYAAGDVGPRR